MAEESTNIFSDKIKLAGVLINKELTMISHVNMVKSMKLGKDLDLDRLEEYNEWGWAWQNVSELYDFLKFEYMDRLKSKEPIIQKELEKIMKNYNYGKEAVSYLDLMLAHDGILKMMVLTGFHNVAQQEKIDQEIEEQDFAKRIKDLV